jgi:hypothetical protein
MILLYPYISYLISLHLIFLFHFFNNNKNSSRFSYYEIHSQILLILIITLFLHLSLFNDVSLILLNNLELNGNYLSWSLILLISLFFILF